MKNTFLIVKVTGIGPERFRTMCVSSETTCTCYDYFGTTCYAICGTFYWQSWTKFIFIIVKPLNNNHLWTTATCQQRPAWIPYPSGSQTRGRDPFKGRQIFYKCCQRAFIRSIYLRFIVVGIILGSHKFENILKRVAIQESLRTPALPC
jgi:hypothetical protein